MIEYTLIDCFDLKIISKIRELVKKYDYKYNSESVIFKVREDSFSEQIDQVLEGTFPKNDMVIVMMNTPEILQKYGMNDYPITITQKHLITIMSKRGKYLNANYHDLNIKTVKNLPSAIQQPQLILKSNTREDSLVLVTKLKDKNNNKIIASIKKDGEFQKNGKIEKSNILTSAYGKEKYEKFIKKNKEQGNVLYAQKSNKKTS